MVNSFTNSDKKKLEKLFWDGFRDDDIAKKMGKSVHQVRQMRSKLKITNRLLWDENLYRYILYQIDKAKKNKMVRSIDCILDISIGMIRLRLKKGVAEGYISNDEYLKATKNIKGC